MLNLKKNRTSNTAPTISYPERFQESILATISEIIYAEEIGESVHAILSGIRHAFNGDVFLFRRSGDFAELAEYSSGKAEVIAELLRKAGIRLSAKKIPLSGGREKLFGSPFVEYGELFLLVGDMTTSAACRKIQSQLGIKWIASTSLDIDSHRFMILVIMSERPPTIREDLEQFSFVFKAAHYLAGLRKRLGQLENRFDEQFVKVKNELREKESAHLYLFNEMTIAAAVLDDRGVVTEANEALKRLVGPDVNPLSQSFSSLVEEESRGDFTEFFVGVGAGQNASTAVSIAGRHFKAYLVTRKKADGERGVSVVYLADDTSDVELQNALGRTIDALRAEKELAEKLAFEARSYSESVVRNSGIPVVAIAEGKIKMTSRSVGEIFEIAEGEQFDQFIARNGLTLPSENQPVSEISDTKGRMFSATRWKIGDEDFIVFDDVTDSRKMEEELGRLSVESQNLLHSLLPTAVVRDGRISEHNKMFESVFAEFLSSDRSFDGFLRYLGESPEAFRGELGHGGIVARMCRTTDRKCLNVMASASEDAVFLFMEDITEQESTKQLLRDAQGLLSNLLESFGEEPVFVVENGVVRAANVAARNKLPVRLDDRIEPAKVLEGIGIARTDDTGELNGRFYKVEDISLGGAEIYRFRQVNQEVAQRAEIENLKRRQKSLRDLSGADRFEAILQYLSELLRSDGRGTAKVVGTGILQVGKGTADVYLMTLASGKMEPSLSLSLTESDVTTVEHGGAFSGIEIPDTTFMNVISSGDSRLIVRSTGVGDSRGFASVAMASIAMSPEYLDEVGMVLKGASSVAAGLHARMSAVKKFEDSGKVTRATVGLTGIGDGSFEDVSRRMIDMLRQVFAAESVGIYSVDGPSMTRFHSNGDLPESLSVPGVKFGALVPSNQFESAQMKAVEGLYFATRSRSQKLAVFFRFLGVPPSPPELSAVSSVSLDILEARKMADQQEKVHTELIANSQAMSEFMTKISSTAVVDDILRVLGDSLSSRARESTVSLQKDDEAPSTDHPMEITEAEDGEYAVYKADFRNTGLGMITVRCPRDPLSQTMVKLSVDKIRSVFAMRLPSVQAEAASLHARLDRAKEEYDQLRQSIEKVPASLRNARIGIDNVLSRLSFVQGDEKVLQEIRLHLASAAKEMSLDLSNSSRDQNELFEAVRKSLLESVSSADDSSTPRIRTFETSVLTEFRTDEATFDLLKDLFSNFVLISGLKYCDILMLTTQPGPGESEEGKGKRIGIRVKAGEGEMPSADAFSGSVSLRTFEEKLEKLGYRLDGNLAESEITLDVFEIRAVESKQKGALSALIVEDDKQLLDEESQSLLQVFARLKVAGDAVEAAKILEVEDFAAAFVDLSLPSINGREVCRQVKQAQPACVTVLLTNREGEEKSEGVDYIALRPLEGNNIRTYIVNK